jgi:hypothetical protein
MNVGTETQVEGQSLQQFLNVTPAQLRTGLSGDVLAQAANSTRAEFHTWMSGTGATNLGDQMAEYLCDFLDTNLVEIFAGVWQTYEEIKRCAGETRMDTSRIAEVVLGDHAFSHELKLEIEVLLNDNQVASIPFTFTTTWTVKDLTLCIRRGGVYKVRGGTCQCSAELRCDEVLVWQCSTESLPLPGQLKLTTPILINI